jgi:ATP-dependent DNA ligase
MMSRSNWLPLKSIIVVSLSEYFLEGYPVSAESQTLRQIPVTWVRPQVVVEVQYYEWTPTGHLHHPVFLRIRDDIDPYTVIGRPTP